jgi:argininosuccinate lyase
VNDGVTSLNGPVLDAVDTTAKTIRLLDAVVAKLAVRPERMLQATEDGFGTATELADTIVRETGMSFRQAHAIVARVVRDAIASGKTAGRIDVADLDAAAHAVVGRPLGLSAETVRTALDATANVAARTATGGPAPAEMARMLADRRTRLSTDEAATAAVATRLKRAGEILEDAVDGLLNAE